MYKKNTKKQDSFSNDNSAQIEDPFINYYQLKHFSSQTSLTSQQIKTHLDKQIFTLPYLDNRLISLLKSLLNDHYGSPAKITNKSGHRRRIALSRDNSRVSVYTDPFGNVPPIKAVLYDSAMYESESIKRMIPVDRVLEFCGKNCKSLSVQTYQNNQPIFVKFISHLILSGFKVTGTKRKRNYYYLKNFRWNAESFRLTLRVDPTQKGMAPAVLQIDKFKPDEASYVDVFWLLKSIQSLNINITPHEIEYQIIFPGADSSLVLDLLRKISLKNIRKSGYHNGTGKNIISYNVKTGSGELLNSTHYIGNYKSCIQTKIYKKLDKDPKLEFVLRRSFLSRMKCNDLEELFNNNVWESLSNKVVFGDLDVDASRRSKNRKALEKAQQRSRTSLHWAKQELPANPYRYIEVDEQFTRKVSSAFAELHDLIKYVWNTVEGEDSPFEVSSSEITQDTAANIKPSTTKIFAELEQLQPVEDKKNTSPLLQ